MAGVDRWPAVPRARACVCSAMPAAYAAARAAARPGRRPRRAAAARCALPPRASPRPVRGRGGGGGRRAPGGRLRGGGGRRHQVVGCGSGPAAANPKPSRGITPPGHAAETAPPRRAAAAAAAAPARPASARRARRAARGRPGAMCLPNARPASGGSQSGARRGPAAALSPGRPGAGGCCRARARGPRVRSARPQAPLELPCRLPAGGAARARFGACRARRNARARTAEGPDTVRGAPAWRARGHPGPGRGLWGAESCAFFDSRGPPLCPSAALERVCAG